jgi:hypothetical protein
MSVSGAVLRVAPHRRISDRLTCSPVRPPCLWMTRNASG